MELNIFTDEYFMKEALREAQKAAEEDEVPIGCVVVSNNRIIARAHNLTETLNDITAHAEMQAITSASNYLGSKYLDECTIYITLEPCLMCAGALRWAQIGRIVYGAPDKKYGFGRYIENITHPKTRVIGGVMQEECSRILSDFFKKKRMK
ncbi:MAG: nucleoside deaminase [Flavobacteriales bacterium]|nr:nucleoside deaminase [Flavobacteriales bacterium]